MLQAECLTAGINRIRLEFKGHSMYDLYVLLRRVLIESDWNLKIFTKLVVPSKFLVLCQDLVQVKMRFSPF